MLVDESMNITYLRSDRITLDNIRPVIGGIENGKTYCEAQTVTIDEKYIDTVTVNGTPVELDENNSFTLSPADGEQKIIVTDKAGNTAEMTVTVNDGHTYGVNGYRTATARTPVNARWTAATGLKQRIAPAAQPPVPKKRYARFAERLTASLTRRITPTL